MNMLTTWRPSFLSRELRPFDALMADFERSFLSWFDTNGRGAATQAPLVPLADIAESGSEYLVSLELPGLELADVDVRLSGNELIVKGERRQKKEQKDKEFHRTETTYGTFERRFELPADARNDPESLKATFHNGMLEIKLQKREPKAITKIPVKAV
jgi:HSP20 family protein